ncbi:hypothetical protein GCM10023329_41660 [Streptomyces sanyensis]|uniref:Uncharacterized protein n=1 Tax=Streptomyces sanyensis TaxID=568869 RepID=A0ABP9AUY8_9ACTN
MAAPRRRTANADGRSTRLRVQPGRGGAGGAGGWYGGGTGWFQDMWPPGGRVCGGTNVARRPVPGEAKSLLVTDS